MDASSTTPNNTPAKEEPEKYIRTFASDMDTLKKGGTPDLAPLHAATVSAGPVSPPPVQSTPTPVQSPTPPPAPPVFFHPPAKGEAKVAAPVVAAEPKNSPLQTYSADFSERVKKTHSSTATILAAEQDRTQRPFQPIPQASSGPNPFYLIGGIVLLIASIGGGSYVAYVHYWAPAAPAVAPTISAPIFFDEREEVSGAGEALLRAVQGSTGRPPLAGTVRLLHITGATSTAATIFSLLPLSAPDSLLRNLNVSGNMAGVITTGGTASPFFILSISSYSAFFSGMLAWEPLMPDYFRELFPPLSSSPPTPITSATTTTASSSPQATTTAEKIPKTVAKQKVPTSAATTTPQTPKATAGFFDVTVANRDVRVYRDTLGRDVFLYGFWDQSTLVIARNTAAFTEIVTRLSTSYTQ